MSSNVDISLIVSGNLALLVKYLRVLGIDCLYDGGLAFCDAVNIALADKRILILDKVIQPFPRLNVICLDSISLSDQICQLKASIPNLSQFEIFSRCLNCNTLLEKCYSKVSAVPASVIERKLVVKHCPSCNRQYWHGDHVDRMLKQLRSFGIPVNPRSSL